MIGSALTLIICFILIAGAANVMKTTFLGGIATKTTKQVLASTNTPNRSNNHQPQPTQAIRPRTVQPPRTTAEKAQRLYEAYRYYRGY